MSINAGELIHDVEIQQKGAEDATNTSGFPKEEWTTLHASVFMSRQEVKGNEHFVAGQVSAPATTRWTMRYVETMDRDLVDVPATRRLLFRGRIYEITAAAPIGRLDGVELTTLVKVG